MLYIISKQKRGLHWHWLRRQTALNKDSVSVYIGSRWKGVTEEEHANESHLHAMHKEGFHIANLEKLKVYNCIEGKHVNV